MTSALDFRKRTKEILNQERALNRRMKEQEQPRKFISPAKSYEAWNKIVDQDQKQTAKTLLVLLEDEKIKFGYLETEYHKLLSEVQALQLTHKRELDQQDKRSLNESRSLQKALLMKTEECSATHDTLKGQVERYLKESSSTRNENEDLRARNGNVKKQFKDIEDKYRTQERMISDIVMTKKEAETRLQSKEYELRTARKELEELQKIYVGEKEGRKKEEYLLKAFEKKFTEKDEEIANLRAKLLKVQGEKEKLDVLKTSLMDTRLDAEQLKRKERQYLDEIEQSVVKERRLLSEVDSHQVQIRKLSGELERVKIKEKAARDDNEFLKSTIQKYKVDVAESFTKIATAEEEIAELNKEVKKYVSKVTILQTESQEVKSSVNKQLDAITELEESNIRLKDAEAHQKRDRDALVKMNQEKTESIKLKVKSLESLQSAYEATQSKLNAEIQSKQELRSKVKDQLIMSQSKFEELQTALDASLKSNEELRRNEQALKQNLTQLQIDNKEFYNQNKDLSNNNVILLGKVSKQRGDFDYTVSHRDEELRSLYQKLDITKSSLEAENNQLKIQVNQKHSKSVVLTEEISHQNESIADLTAHCTKLESRVADLISAKVTANTALTSIQSHLSQKEQECSVYKAKLDTTRDQLNRVEEELEQYRTVSARKDVDMSRLQTNVTDLSRRLKSQVDMILEKDHEYNSSVMSSGSESNTKQKRVGTGRAVGEPRPILGYEAFLN